MNILLLMLRVPTCRNDDNAPGKVPREDDLGGCDFVLGCEFNDEGVVADRCVA